MGKTSKKSFNLSRSVDGIAQSFRGRGWIHLFDKKKGKNKNISLNLKESLTLERKLHKLNKFLKHIETTSKPQSTPQTDTSDQSQNSYSSDSDE